MYQYETIKNMPREQQQAFIDAGNTAPVALNADGKIIYDDNGDPLQMKFNYANDGTGKNYNFRGGDAMYEDVNHDGQINSLDIMYLGSSLPKLTGGFGFSVNYKDLKLSAQFTYRVGVDILNLARLDAEAMINNNNQSQAVNYRWRKEGDETTIPRAMYGKDSNYNTLISDRFVEDGSFIRLKTVSLGYTLPTSLVKKVGLDRARLYFNGTNLLTFSKYKWADPEVNAYGTRAFETPIGKTYTFGIELSF